MPVIRAEGKIEELEAMAANAQLTLDWLWTLNIQAVIVASVCTGDSLLNFEY